MSRITACCEWLLRQSLVWGGIACCAFYVLVIQNLDPNSTAYRYFAGDGWEVKGTTGLLFFVGMAALLIKLFGVVVQFGALDRTGLSPIPSDGQSVEDVDGLIAELDQAPHTLQGGYLLSRLRSALQFVKQKGSADTLESQLHHLEDAAVGRMSNSYASIRVIASTIPILGFLGTVVGITIAIFQLSAQDIEKSLPAVIAGLSVAFDTTAQALALSIFLLFTKFGVERVEMKLLGAVDDRVNQQLLGRFRQYGSDKDPHVASIKRMCEKLLEAVESSVARQESVVAQSIAASGRASEEMAAATGRALERAMAEGLAAGLKAHANALNDGVAKHTADLEGTLVRHAQILSEGIDAHTTALADALEHHTAVITQTETNLSVENRKQLVELEAALGEAMLLAATRQEKLITQSEQILREMQSTLVESAGTAVAQQQQLIRQSDVLLRIVESTAHVRKLEEALNSNLSSLAHSHHFEETVVGLSAALQLLSANLGRPLSLRNEVDFGGDEASSQAA